MKTNTIAWYRLGCVYVILANFNPALSATNRETWYWTSSGESVQANPIPRTRKLCIMPRKCKTNMCPTLNKSYIMLTQLMSFILHYKELLINTNDKTNTIIHENRILQYVLAVAHKHTLSQPYIRYIACHCIIVCLDNFSLTVTKGREKMSNLTPLKMMSLLMQVKFRITSFIWRHKL